MHKPTPPWMSLSEAVAQALSSHKPVVALESTVISHGLPHPLNLDTARACEEAISGEGAQPATIALVDGIVKVGLTPEELESFAVASTDRDKVKKTSLSNLAAILASREMGATTVATSLTLARAAGIQVFSTGGIGGVHRGVEQTFDVSADLTALASTPVICVCSGAKAILDLPRTVELLETTGVPIVGFKATEFAAFYSRSSGLPVDYAAESAADVARFATVHWGTGANTAVLVSAPVPEEFEIDSKEVQSAVATALALAEENGIRGKEVTPYLLAQLERLTSSRSLKANRALLINNARIAASIAKALRMGGAKGRMGEGAEGRTERIQ